MTATRDDIATAGQLRPDEVRRYLIAGGWQPMTSDERASIWATRDGDDDFEVLLPLDIELRDYPARVLDTLHTVSVVEDRPIGLIVGDILNTTVDTQYFRLLSTGPSGTIPLLNGVEAHAGLRELVLAATYSTMIERPLVVQGRRPTRVRKFAHQVRLGAPTAGSYILSAQVPLADSSVGPSDSTPLGRRMVLTMHRAIRSCHVAAAEALRTGNLDPFVRRVEDGVSANVCEALGMLGSDDNAFEVRFAWAQRWPVDIPTPRLRFDPHVIRVIRDAGEELRNRLPDGLVELVGPVIRLRRDGDAGGTARIRGRLTTVHGESETAVTVRLQAGFYDRAVEAHRRQTSVRLRGISERGKIVHVDTVAFAATDAPGEEP